MLSYATPVQPRQVRLELSSACNARCVTCHRLTMTRTMGHMDFGLVQKCIADIKQFPWVLQEICPTNYGEVFLHPEWKRLLRYISANLPNTRIVLPTNGRMLDQEAIQVLAALPNLKWVNISVNAFLPATYEAFTGIPAATLDFIAKAAQSLRAARPDITIMTSMVYDSQYQSPRERELFIEHWQKLGIQAAVESAQYNNRADREPPVPVSLPCRSLFSDLVVLQDGQVVSCCFAAEPVPELVVGDANKGSLLDIWHSEAFNRIRLLHNSERRADLAICRRCTFA